MLDKDIISVVSEEIAYFLTIENQAAIPGFGRFISVAQPAIINDETNLLTAPTIKITFQPNLEESDTNFTDYFGEYHTIGNTLDDFIEKFITKIKEEDCVLLPELGMCILNKEGAVHFEGLDQSTNVSGFGVNTVALKPVSKPQVESRPEGVNTPGAAALAVNTNSRSKLIRMGMVLSTLVLIITFLFNYQWPNANAAEFQKVSTNYNVSPQDQDVIVASMDGDAPSGTISSERKKEILDRQRQMSEAIPELEMQTATIITNTFGSLTNVEKQLELISELGYQGSTFQKENGLVSTLITLEYQKEEELDGLLEEIKLNFHRAKVKK